MSDTAPPPAAIRPDAPKKSSGEGAEDRADRRAARADRARTCGISAVSFDWRSLGPQLRSVSVWMVLAGIAIIYVCYWLRAMRWSVLLKSLRPASTSESLSGADHWIHGSRAVRAAG